MKKLLCGLFFLSFILSACTKTSQEEQPANDQPLKEMSGKQIKLDNITIDGKKMDADGNPIDDAQSSDVIPSVAKQISYTTESAAQSYVGSGPTIYFFKADWCPTCKEAQKDLDNNISTLPSGTTIITVNYDTESILKKKYGITYQHTWVLIDDTGKAVTKWNGGGVKEIAQHIETH